MMSQKFISKTVRSIIDGINRTTFIGMISDDEQNINNLLNFIDFNSTDLPFIRDKINRLEALGVVYQEYILSESFVVEIEEDKYESIIAPKIELSFKGIKDFNLENHLIDNIIVQIRKLVHEERSGLIEIIWGKISQTGQMSFIYNLHSIKNQAAHDQKREISYSSRTSQLFPRININDIEFINYIKNLPDEMDELEAN